MERQPSRLSETISQEAGELNFTRAQIIDGNWQVHARCRELPPDTFFPSDGAGVEAAKRICADCVVKDPCLEYAIISRIEHGVWGGTGERERRRIAKRYKPKY